MPGPPAELRGDRVVLEPLDVSHAPELFAALDDAEVWEHLPRARSAGPEDLAGLLAAMLREHAAGVRVPWVHREACCGATGSGPTAAGGTRWSTG